MIIASLFQSVIESLRHDQQTINTKDTGPAYDIRKYFEATRATTTHVVVCGKPTLEIRKSSDTLFGLRILRSR
jgi:hypothetical protein